jgi:hypothetical protein
MSAEDLFAYGKMNLHILTADREIFMACVASIDRHLLGVRAECDRSVGERN